MKIYLVLLFFSGLIALKAQKLSPDGILIKKRMLAIEKADAISPDIVFTRSGNPFKVLAFSFIYVYQKIFSQQISAVCEFDRSCSAFGISSVKELGIIKAVFLTADRLTRCNGQAQVETQNYLINHTSGKVTDEPSMYSFNH
ncbi:MAG: membrane protein insertion efficiency factor YidD [Bacteroidetes bacterium]|nr:membrane protein insertion efficiency factor YidD [Bacteroidota bacterium]